MDRTVMRRHRRGAISELVHVQLADDNGSRGLETPNYFRILRRHTIGEDRAGGCSAYAGCVDQIFQSNWNAVQRSAPSAALALGFEFACLRQRLLAHDRDVRVERRVEFLDSVQALLSKLDRGSRLLAN